MEITGKGVGFTGKLMETADLFFVPYRFFFCNAKLCCRLASEDLEKLTYRT